VALRHGDYPGAQGILRRLQLRSATELEGLLGDALSPRTSIDELEASLSMSLSRMERGASRILGFVARSACLVGLIGTLLGVQLSLQAYAEDPRNVRVVLEGFGTAINTTLAGAAVAFCALCALKLLVQRATAKRADAVMKGLVGVHRLAVRVDQARQRQRPQTSESGPSARSGSLLWTPPSFRTLQEEQDVVLGTVP